jgi:predicted transcriptional regulator
VAILTLDVPDELAARLAALARAQGEDVDEYALATLQGAVEAIETREAEDDPEIIAAIERGIADVQAGRLMTLYELRRQLQEARAGSFTTPAAA